MFKKVLSVLLAVFMACTLFGCSNGGGKTDVDTETPIKIEVTTAPVGLHPLKTNDSASTYVNQQVYETLYRRSVDGTTYEPLLAAELPSYSEDGLTATITLRSGVTFHNGDAFTAEAVAYMIDCLKDSTYGSQRPSIVASIESYEVLDDTHIQLNLKYNDGILLACLAHTNGAIVNPALDKGQDLLVDPTGAGTGAYKFVSATTGSVYTLTANENYWGGTPSIKNVEFDVVPDESTAVARLQTGEADLYPTVSADSFAQVSTLSGVTAVSNSNSSVYYMAYRSNDTAKNDLMANKDFRTALCQAVDYETFVASYFGTNATFAKSIIGPTLVGYTKEMDNYYINYDPDTAKATIDANGWAGQELTFLCSTRDAHMQLAAYVQDSLAKVGITVKVVSEEWATFLASAKTDEYFDFCILSWSNVTGDGHQMISPNFQTGNDTRVKYRNEEFDAYCNAAARTTVLAERQAAMLEAVKLIQTDAVASPVYSINTMYAYSERLGNVAFDKGGQFTLKDWTLLK